MAGSVRAAIVLAAGASRRMQYPKARLPLNPFTPGPTFLDRALALAAAAGADPVLVVVGPDASAAFRNESLQNVVNPRPERGMFSSIQIGLAAVRERAPLVEQVLVLLVDHPLVRPDTVARLCAVPAGPLVAPTYRGRRGHPVVLGRAGVDAVLRAEASERLDVLLGEMAMELPVNDPGVLRNINTPERYNWFFGPLPPSSPASRP